LEDADNEKIGALVEDKSPQLRAAVAEFIATHVLGEKAEEATKGKKGKKKAAAAAAAGGDDEDEEGPTVENVMNLVNFIESKGHAQSVEYTVDSLWGTSSVLTAWPLLVKVITDEVETELTEEQRSILIHVLLCAVTRANGWPIVGPRPLEPVCWKTSVNYEQTVANFTTFRRLNMKSTILCLHCWPRLSQGC